MAPHTRRPSKTKSKSHRAPARWVISMLLMRSDLPYARTNAIADARELGNAEALASVRNRCVQGWSAFCLAMPLLPDVEL